MASNQISSDNNGMGVHHPPALSDVLPWQVERGAYAYEAYKRASAGRSTITGASLPDWKDLRADTMRAWVEAACAVCARFGAIL